MSIMNLGFAPLVPSGIKQRPSCEGLGSEGTLGRGDTWQCCPVLETHTLQGWDTSVSGTPGVAGLCVTQEN